MDANRDLAFLENRLHNAVRYLVVFGSPPTGKLVFDPELEDTLIQSLMQPPYPSDASRPAGLSDHHPLMRRILDVLARTIRVLPGLLRLYEDIDNDIGIVDKIIYEEDEQMFNWSRICRGMKWLFTGMAQVDTWTSEKVIRKWQERHVDWHLNHESVAATRLVLDDMIIVCKNLEAFRGENIEEVASESSHSFGMPVLGTRRRTTHQG
jgi:hypothetical protein